MLYTVKDIGSRYSYSKL